MTFGKWLARKRVEADLTQEDLGKRAGISGSYISGLEREEPNTKDGKPRQPRRDKVESIAKALGVPVNEALEEAGYRSERHDETHELLEGVVLMFEDTASLTDDQKRKIMDLVRVIAAGVIAEDKK